MDESSDQIIAALQKEITELLEMIDRIKETGDAKDEQIRQLEGFLLTKNKHLLALEDARKARLSDPRSYFDETDNSASLPDAEDLYRIPSQAKVVAQQVAIEKSRLASVSAAVRTEEVNGRAAQAAVQGIKADYAGWVIKLENVKLEVQKLTLQKIHLEQQNTYHTGANSQQNVYNMYGPIHGGVPMPPAFDASTQNDPVSNPPSFAPPVHNHFGHMPSVATTSATVGLQGQHQSFSNTMGLPFRGSRVDTVSPTPQPPAPPTQKEHRPMFHNKCTRRGCRDIACRFVHPWQREKYGAAYCDGLPIHAADHRSL